MFKYLPFTDAPFFIYFVPVDLTFYVPLLSFMGGNEEWKWNVGQCANFNQKSISNIIQKLLVNSTKLTWANQISFELDVISLEARHGYACL